MSRDFRLDILRSISLFLIFLAHTNPPEVLLQIRNFDVVSMVLVSGMSFALSYKKSGYLMYIFKRIKRLLIPTWKFLTFFFFFFFLLALIFGTDMYSLLTILLSYSLLEGIGYVWIVKVFLFLAILNPFLYKLSSKIKNNVFFVILIISGVFIYKFIFFSLSNYLTYPFDFLYDRIIVEAIGYSIVSLIGIRLITLSKKQVRFSIVLSGIWYIFELILHDFDYVQDYKYPPDLFFLSYGILITMVIFFLVFELKTSYNKFISWTSKYSLDIYFWHIFAIHLITKFYSPSSFGFFVYYIYLLFFAFFVTYIQKNIYQK